MQTSNIRKDLCILSQKIPNNFDDMKNYINRLFFYKVKNKRTTYECKNTINPSQKSRKSFYASWNSTVLIDTYSEIKIHTGPTNELVDLKIMRAIWYLFHINILFCQTWSIIFHTYILESENFGMNTEFVKLISEKMWQG